MAICLKCPINKPVSDFYTDRSRKEGHCRWCKSCMNAYQRSERGRAAHNKANAKYQQTPKGKAAIRKGVAKHSKTPKGKATMKRFRVRHPNQIKAKSAVNNAIYHGRLPSVNTRQCHYCPEQAEQYHHYLGYEKEHWLDVMPACLICHRKEHRRIA